MRPTTKTVRRWAGVIFLFLALAMLVPGLTILDGRLPREMFLLYWLGCFVCTVVAMLVALREAADVRHHAMQEHRHLLEETLAELSKEKTTQGPNAAAGKNNPPTPPGKA